MISKTLPTLGLKFWHEVGVEISRGGIPDLGKTSGHEGPRDSCESWVQLRNFDEEQSNFSFTRNFFLITKTCGGIFRKAIFL